VTSVSAVSAVGAPGVLGLVAALLAAGSVLAVAPRRPVLPGGPASDGSSGGGAPAPRWVVLAACTVAAAVVLLDGAAMVLALVATGCAAATLQAWRRHGRARIRDERRARVVEVGEAMVGELRAGQPPQVALARAGEVWPDLSPVVAAARLGADVPEALRDRARLPGAEGLTDLAAAWQVSQRSGAALTTSLGQVVASGRARQLAQHLVRGELSSARATARLVALLPAGTLAMSAGIGGDPWSFLFGHPVGLGCLGAGTALVFAGLAWIDRMAAAVERS
jgi:tight adherence protein B